MRLTPPLRAVRASLDPLRILFCGSDAFSIASLRALHARHVEAPDRIRSIDVVCRPGKPTGRGLKRIREVPIHDAARQLRLPVHQVDTFTGWQPPRPGDEPINLVVAVSFGLLVPPRILQGARYGGVNVHPSLLPDLRGPAPIHHALLRGDAHAGITVQTMHPRRFDHGAILAQTPRPGLAIPRGGACTPDELIAALAPRGGALLLETLGSDALLSPPPPPPPRADEGHEETGARETHRGAPKITAEDRHVDWSAWGADEIVRRTRVLDSLWSVLRSRRREDADALRVRWEGWQVVPEGEELASGVPYPHERLSVAPPGSYVGGGAALAFATCDRPPRALRVTRCTVDGGIRGKGVGRVQRLFWDGGPSGAYME